MQPQQIPQVQMIPQNINMPNPVANPPQENQIIHLIQTEAPNMCEKISKFFTGNTNIPFVVFIILMSSFGYLICCVLFGYGHFAPYMISSALFDFIFAVFVWSKMAIKIEANTTTVKYGYLYLLNLLILSVITLSFPLTRIWNFILFETLLISLNNKDKNIKFFCCRISGTKVIIFTIIYHIFFNSLNIISIIITIAYAYIYSKYLTQKFNISNEKIERYENTCLIKFFKEKFQTFITLQDVLNKNKNNQPLVQNANDNINNNNGNNVNISMSFIPINMYPNYNSIVVPNPNIPQAQPLPPVNQIQVPPVVDINQPA